MPVGIVGMAVCIMAEGDAPGADLSSIADVRRGDPMFGKRVASAVVLAPLSLVLVIWGGAWFAIFVATFAAAMAWEWVRMSDKGAPLRAFAIAVGTAVGAVLFSAQHDFIRAGVWLIGGAITAYLDRRSRGRAWEALGGVAYVAGSAAIVIALRVENGIGVTGLLFLLAVVWTADTFAYLVGSWVGGWKLLPIASPNKTWAGLLAGLVFGTIAGASLALCTGWDAMHGALLAAPTACAAVGGDLLMSLAKRRFGVKDAGTVIPGHGGVLDRVDALMLASVFAGVWAVAGPGGWPGGGA